jgi:hypothetical protein
MHMPSGQHVFAWGGGEGLTLCEEQPRGVLKLRQKLLGKAQFATADDS